jgi:hypothetical protein
VLGFVDDALESAAEANTKKSKDVDEKFAKAIKILSEYEASCRPKNPASKAGETVCERMKIAMARDKSTSTTLNKLREKILVREELSPSLHRVLTPIPSQLNQNRREPSSFFSTGLFLIGVPPS